MALNVAIGIVFVIAMALLARTEFSWINGILPLFPTFALIGQASTFAAKGDAAAGDVAFVGLFTLAPYAAYLLSVYCLSNQIGFPRAAGAGILLWIFLTTGIIYIRSKIL